MCTYVITRDRDTRFLLVPATLSMSHVGRWSLGSCLSIVLAAVPPADVNPARSPLADRWNFLDPSTMVVTKQGIIMLYSGLHHPCTANRVAGTAARAGTSQLTGYSFSGTSRLPQESLSARIIGCDTVGRGCRCETPAVTLYPKSNVSASTSGLAFVHHAVKWTATAMRSPKRTWRFVRQK